MHAPDSLSLDDLLAAVHSSLTTWADLGSSEEDLLAFLFLVQQARSEVNDNASTLDLRRTTNRVLEAAIDELGQQDETEAAVLRARFVEGLITRQVAGRLHASPDQINRWQRSAITHLSQIILAREQALRQKTIGALMANLPPPTYARLFGFQEARAIVLKQLLRPDAPWIVTIAGIGGIGKTSLADTITRDVIRALTFEEVVWLRANNRNMQGAIIEPEQCFQELLAALSERLWPNEPTQGNVADQKNRLIQVLRSRTHLIVIDNLETEDTTNFILEETQALVRPSKMLLTTRTRPSVSAPAFFFSLDELPFTDASDLLRQHAQGIGIENLARADESDIQAIYDLTGGNPLALKLVASLVAVLPLPQILADLARSRPGPIEDLYRHIYWEAWRSLGQEAQELLEAMPLVAESGALPEQMQAISGLDEGKFWPAVTELAERSLLEIRGTIQERRYGIHRLTETFLQTEIIHWPADK